MNPINEKNAVEVARTVRDTPVQSAGTVRRSLSITTLATAMVSVQKDIVDPHKNKKAEAGRAGTYKYADLPAVLDVVRPALTANGFAVMQLPCEIDGEAGLTTLLMHVSGEWIETTVKIRAVDGKPQSMGSGQSYARRYALLALCGIAADDDDDGRAASQPKPAQHQTTAPKPPTAPTQSPVPSQWAIDFARKVQAVPTRDAGIELWKEYEAKMKAGHVPTPDKALIDGEFKAMGARFPKEPAQQSSGAK